MDRWRDSCPKRHKCPPEVTQQMNGSQTSLGAGAWCGHICGLQWWRGWERWGQLLGLQRGWLLHGFQSFNSSSAVCSSCWAGDHFVCRKRCPFLWVAQPSACVCGLQVGTGLSRVHLPSWLHPYASPVTFLSQITPFQYKQTDYKGNYCHDLWETGIAHQQ